MIKNSYLQKFMFNKLPIKGSFVVLDDVWNTIVKQKDYPDGLQQIIGDIMTANVLLTSNLKLDGKVICQIQDNPHFGLVVSECSNDLKVRATAKFSPESETIIPYEEYLTSGRLVVSIDSQNDGQLYQSVIAFNGDNVAEILNNYMLQSEQLKTWFLLSYTPTRMVGFMLQQLPDVHEIHTDDIERVFMLANTLTKTELQHDDSETILFKLFNEDDIVIMDKHHIDFRCTCNRGRLEQILRNLGATELNDIIDTQGDISVSCDYCNTEYKFTKNDLEGFLAQITLNELDPISTQLN
ncbi:MAG: Hsp33 family molecular chaperone HslO [Burkholderiales bacterium]|nr:Hsp33 family molecular chaperone HslO [Burkholderiales bacterium]